VINGGTLDLDSLTVKECTATNGGAIYSIINGAGTLTITNGCHITNCKQLSGSGGAIYTEINENGKFIISASSKISDCSSDATGGGI
jgi:hypothetical protein